eukprot:6120226-Karenia_brevis.AAC.1
MCLTDFAATEKPTLKLSKDDMRRVVQTQDGEVVMRLRGDKIAWTDAAHAAFKPETLEICTDFIEDDR